MIHEYAASPALFESESHATVLYHLFGPESGRLLCEYPKRKWAQLAIAVIKSRVADGALQARLRAALMALAKQVIARQGESWSDNETWIANVIAEHGRIPFRSILWEGPGQPHECIRTPSLTLCDDPIWIGVPSIHVQRTAAAMVKPITQLLQLSRKVVLVDRNFNPADGRWVNVLLEAVNVLRQNPRQLKIDHIDLVLANMNKVSNAQLERTAKESIEPRLPQGFTVRIKLKTSNKLHARYVLTDISGVQFADGLDELTAPGTAPTLITRLSQESHRIELAASQSEILHSFDLLRT